MACPLAPPFSWPVLRRSSVQHSRGRLLAWAGSQGPRVCGDCQTGCGLQRTVTRSHWVWDRDRDTACAHLSGPASCLVLLAVDTRRPFPQPGQCLSKRAEQMGVEGGAGPEGQHVLLHLHALHPQVAPHLWPRGRNMRTSCLEEAGKGLKAVTASGRPLERSWGWAGM